MKVFFIIVLALNFVFEGLAGVALIFGESGFAAAEHPVSGNWAMNYGFAALAIAAAIGWVWPHKENYAVVGTVLGLLVTFHVFLAVSLGIAGNQVGAMAAHAIMAALCVFAFSQRSKWCTA